MLRAMSENLLFGGNLSRFNENIEQMFAKCKKNIEIGEKYRFAKLVHGKIDREDRCEV